MARELILHIGHYKTGTTALQVFLERNRDLLAAQGLHYARAPVMYAKHSALAFSLYREAGVTELMHNFSKPETAAELWQALFAEVRALPDGASLLVSTEEFMRLGAHPAAVELLKAQIATAGDLRFRVIAYLRAPQAHLRSWYNQLVKMGADVGGFATAVRTQMEPIHWDYALALRPWVDLFGTEALVLRQFASRLREGDALFADFLEALGFAVPVLADVPGGDPNPRLDDRLLAYRRGLNRVPLPKRVKDQMHSLARAGIEAEDGALEGPDLATIRDRARAGIDLAASMPGTGIDPAAMLADLPDLPDGPMERLDATLAMMASEIARLRGHVVSLSGRIAELEKDAQGRTAGGPDNGEDAA